MKVGKKKVTKSGREQLNLEKQRQINNVCPECQDRGCYYRTVTGGLFNLRKLEKFQCECGTEWTVDIGRKEIDWDDIDIPDAVFAIIAILGIAIAVLGLVLTIEMLFSGITLIAVGIAVFTGAFIAGANNY